ncbi:MAG: hypothetical protein H6729_02545 [Deltaproteobacteria bacterium]|nr:hypothetical protein [Deltaproteobacteria bacterium]
MRTGVRNALILGGLAALIAAATIDVDGATVLGHLRRGQVPPSFEKTWTRLVANANSFWDEVQATKFDDEPNPNDDSEAPVDPADEKALTEKIPRENVRRTAILRNAVAKSAPQPKKAASGGKASTAKKTHVDERITPEQKKALNKLLKP